MREKKLIQLYVTNMCNSHCKTCSIWKNKEAEELSMLFGVEKIVAAFPDADYVIGGGEAILHKNIDRLLYFLYRKKVNYTLLSNCIMISRLCDLVKKYNVPAVTVSCDGINHDEIRGSKDNLVHIRMFQKFCFENGIKFKVSYTYSKYNEKTFEQDMDMFRRDMGLDVIYFCIAQDMDLLKTAENGESFMASNFEQILKCDLISDKDKAHIRGMITGIRRCCTSQNNVHTIYSNGDIVRCQSFKSKEILGNINDMLVGDIIEVLSSVQNKPCFYDVECNLLCQRRYD